MIRTKQIDIEKVELVKNAAISLMLRLGRRPNQEEIQKYINSTQSKTISKKDIIKVISFNEKGGISS